MSICEKNLFVSSDVVRFTTITYNTIQYFLLILWNSLLEKKKQSRMYVQQSFHGRKTF